MKRLLFAAVFVMLFSFIAMGDIPRPSTPKPTATPKQKKSIETSLIIRLDRDAKDARLIIPKAQIQQLRAELDELDGGENNTAAVSRGSFTGTQTVISGMFLTLAFVFGGVWLARSGKTVSKNSRALGIGAFLFLGGAFATFVFANAGPPPEARSITGKMFTDAVHMCKQGSGAIKLETSDEERDYIQLIVPDPKTGPKPEDEE
jgi:hypothetical protein